MVNPGVGPASGESTKIRAKVGQNIVCTKQIHIIVNNCLTVTLLLWNIDALSWILYS